LVGNLNCTPLDFNFHPSTGASRLPPTDVSAKRRLPFEFHGKQIDENSTDRLPLNLNEKYAEYHKTHRIEGKTTE
jgi:hypothetical protein